MTGVRKYRKKPVVIEALQWTGDNHRDMFNFLENKSFDEWIIAEGENFYIDHGEVPGGLVIKTLEGVHVAQKSDFIIKGVANEFYPCKLDIFEKTYELVEDEVEEEV